MRASRNPSLLDLALEGRAVLEWASYFAARPWLEPDASGDGHPVLVLPGLLTNDLAMAPMRDFLADSGFCAYPWAQGVNVGPKREVLKALSARLNQIAQHHGQKVSLVGWSMGGAMAMGLAQQHPALVRCVVTLGSPLGADENGSSITGLYERVSGLKAADARLLKLAQGHPDVPTTSLVSKGDGVVSWTSGVLPSSRCHETVAIRTASHLGLPAHPVALLVIADRLSQQPGRWRRFAPPQGVLAWLAQPLAPLSRRRKQKP